MQYVYEIFLFCTRDINYNTLLLPLRISNISEAMQFSQSQYQKRVFINAPNTWICIQYSSRALFVDNIQIIDKETVDDTTTNLT